MGTRCVIEIVDDKCRYRIYRHWDGQPEAVLADIALVQEKTLRGREFGLTDPEYFLANFIFFAKLSSYEKYKNTKNFHHWLWETGYGVCSPNCSHGDLAYKYILTVDGEITIQRYDWRASRFRTIFKGWLYDALQKFVPNYPQHLGSHIDGHLLDAIHEQVKAAELKA